MIITKWQMGLRRAIKNEDFEWIANRDLVDSAHLLWCIDLDPASSKKANEFVNARDFVPTDDSLNEQNWHGNVYLFPPHTLFGINKVKMEAYQRAVTYLTAGHAIWWRTLKRNGWKVK